MPFDIRGHQSSKNASQNYYTTQKNGDSLKLSIAIILDIYDLWPSMDNCLSRLQVNAV